MTTLNDVPVRWSNDSLMVATMRLMLAVSALAIIYIDPAEPDRYVAATYSALGLYFIYSVILYALARHRRQLQTLQSLAHWGDVGWYTLLITLSSGTNSLFFFGFYFSILVASFHWGFASGVRTTLVSTALFAVVDFTTTPRGPAFELTRFLLRPTYLLVFGYMMAYWGGFEVMLQRRLVLLKDVVTLLTPRAGMERALSMVIEQLSIFYNASCCMLMQSDQSNAVHRRLYAHHHNPEVAEREVPMPDGLERILNMLPAEQAVIYCRGSHRWKWWCPWSRGPFYNVINGNQVMGSPEVNSALPHISERESFVLMPLSSRKTGMIYRLYLTVQQRHAFDVTDMDFLLQVGTHVAPILDNIRLVDQLASDAAEDERRRIARNLHDSVIQPYIGVQMGLIAIRRKLATDNTDVASDLNRLIQLADIGVSELRHYANGLRDGRGEDSDLLPAAQRFATKFAEVTGLTVSIEAETDIHVENRLAAEVFQMIAEGLSNVRRHTNAKQATVRLACPDGYLILQIENESTVRGKPFTPRSISERAAALGGHVRIEWDADNRTVVTVEVPQGAGDVA